jgi:hypothetical protein
MVNQVPVVAIDHDDSPVPLGQLIARVALIVLQIAMAFYLGLPSAFFYQGF